MEQKYSFEPEDQPITLAPRPTGVKARLRELARYLNPNYLLRPRPTPRYSSAAPRQSDGSRPTVFNFNGNGWGR